MLMVFAHQPGAAMIPSKTPDDLSPEARAVFGRAVRSSRAYEVHEMEMPFAREVADAHLGSLYISDRAATLTPVRLSNFFTVADSGSVNTAGLYIEVEFLPHGMPDEPGALLAVLLDAEFYRFDNGRLPWPQWRIGVRHATATDTDHAHVYLADLKIDNPVTTRVLGGETVFIGLLNSALLYPLGHDVTKVDEYDEPIDPTDLCTAYESCKARPHVYGAKYIPPHRDDLDAVVGMPVRITVQARTAVDEHGVRLGTSTITHEQQETI
jgi:hypothetical protein